MTIMNDRIIARWLAASLCLLLFFLPVLLQDELTLLTNWLLILSSWLLVIIITAYPSIKAFITKRDG